MRTPIAGMAALAAVLVVVPSSARAAAGDLDPSFGTNGKVITRLGSYAIGTSLVLQPDERIVLGGYAYDDATGWGPALARYAQDGRLDTSFGSGGTVKGPPGLADGWAVAIQRDGKILLAGREFAVARYNKDGTIDVSFGTGGLARGPISSSENWARAVAVQADGKILVGGFYEVTNNSLDTHLALVRFNSDGSLDSTFGNGGTVTTAVGSEGDRGFSLALQPDGKILLAGGSLDLSGGGYLTIARYHRDGSLDTGFGSEGVVRDDRMFQAFGLALQPDGRILASGMSAGPPEAFALARFTANGRADSTFGREGIVLTAIGSQSYAQAIGLQGDGKIVLAGSSKDGDWEFALARYTANGSLDTQFGTGGTATSLIGSVGSGANALAIQPDGQIVVGGFSWDVGSTSDAHFALARYVGSTVLTIEAAPSQVIYRTAVHLSGRALKGAATGSVTLLSEACGDSAKPLGTSTAADGSWSATTNPVSTTTYRAEVGKQTSSPTTVLVQPRVRLTQLGLHRFRVTVRAAQAFSGQPAIFQRFRRSTKEWLTVRSVLLEQVSAQSSTFVSGKRFTSRSGAGSLVRVALPRRTVAPCYEPAVSNIIRG